jgi:hypothetical protein
MDKIPPAAPVAVPRGPNFSLVVAVAVVLLFAILIAAYLFLHHDAHKVIPQQTQTPTALILR